MLANKGAKAIVDFLIIGAPKSGTTALNQYLSEHPDINIPNAKEIHFFGSEFKQYTQRRKEPMTLEQYHEFFKDQKKLNGEASVFYLYSEDSFQQILDYNPEMKIIVMLRNPVDFLVSYHQDCIYLGIEKEKSFTKALGNRSIKERENAIADGIDYIPVALDYWEMVNYAKYLSRFIKSFKPKNLKIVIFEEFFENPSKGYDDLINFIGLNLHKLGDFPKINEKRITKNRSLYNFLNLASGAVRRFIRFFLPFQGLRIYIYNLLMSLNTKKNATIINVDLEEKRRLMIKLKPMIIKLEEYLDLDLSVWKKKYE